MKIAIHTVPFELPDRYAEGHTINANEAAVLNQAVMENVGNNFRDKVKEWKGTPEELQAAFAEYANNYQFGKRTTRASAGVPTDPVSAEAHRLAVVAVKDLLRKANKPLKGVPQSVINEAANQLIANDASFREQAEANVQASANRTPAQLDIEALIASIPAKPEAPLAPDGTPSETETQPAQAPELTEAPTNGKRRGRG